MGKRESFRHLFINYGMGIQSFFKLLTSLSSAYLVLSVIAVIQMCIMYQYNKGNENISFLQKISLGGFPQSAPICKVVPASLESINVECSGDDTIIEVVDYGILPSYKILDPSDERQSELQNTIFGDSHMIRNICNLKELVRAPK